MIIYDHPGWANCFQHCCVLSKWWVTCRQDFSIGHKSSQRPALQSRCREQRDTQTVKTWLHWCPTCWRFDTLRKWFQVNSDERDDLPLESLLNPFDVIVYHSLFKSLFNQPWCLDRKWHFGKHFKGLFTLLTSPPLITKRIPVSAAATSTVVAPHTSSMVWCG